MEVAYMSGFFNTRKYILERKVIPMTPETLAIWEKIPGIHSERANKVLAFWAETPGKVKSGVYSTEGKVSRKIPLTQDSFDHFYNFKKQHNVADFLNSVITHYGESHTL